jgi:squalene synthase HpnC
MRKTLTSPDVAADALENIAASALDQHASENFPVALRFLPRDVRADLLRVYTFARFVDDVGDRATGDRAALLDQVAADVRSLPAGGAALAPVAGLAPLIATRGLRIEPLLDLVEANRMDQTISRYETFEGLLAYCAKSAAPIGRLVLLIAGQCAELAVSRSDRVCAALQVLEHCQDVREDARAGRVYLPAEELRAAGVGDDDLRAGRTSRPLRRVVATQVDRAEQLLGDGPLLIAMLRGWARLAVSGYVAGGRATVHALRAADYDVVAQEIRPSKPRTVIGTARLTVRGRP